MVQRKAKDDYLTQREKFMKTAREHGVDEKSDKAFLEVVRKIAKAPPQKAKKAARKSKR
jgi:hypothetical protein